MSKQRLTELKQLIADKSAAIETLFLDGEKRGSNTADEMKSISDMTTEVDGFQKEANDIKVALDLRAQNHQRLLEVGKPSNAIPFAKPADESQPRRDPTKAVSDMLFGDDRFKSWYRDLTASGHISESADIKSPRVGLDLSLKTLITGLSDTSAGALVFPDFKPIIDVAYQRPLTIRDVIQLGETSSDQVEYVRVTGVTNNAAPVAEATSTSTGTKPESAMATERVVAVVKTIAHWIPITTRALADAPQIRTYVDSFLRYGLLEELEDQLVSGNNVGENFDGVLNATGTTAQAFDTDVLTTTRKAKTLVRITGRATPNAYVMNPLDWQNIDLSTDNEKRYYYGGPQNVGQPRLWGLPVVESEAMPEGTFVVADWKLAILWDRMQTTLTMTNSHSDFFVKNLIVLLAELRAAFSVIRPQAFVVGDLTA